MFNSYVIFLISILLISTNYWSQDSLRKDWRARIPINETGFIEFNQYIQYWNVLSLRYTNSDSDPRLDPHIRRGRLGISGRLNEQWLFNASFAYDGVGKDPLTTSAGIPNAEDNQTFFPRDILFTYRHHPLLNITAGYFRPRVGKESIYSSSFNISQEKGFPSYQPRFHITGRGIGRETGMNIGGLVTKSKFSLLYDVGLFDPNHPSIRGNGVIWSPLLAGRTVIMLGDREMTEYLTTYFQSGYGQRKGISVGGSWAYQSRTDLFRNNGLLAAEMQLNWGSLDVVTEYMWMFRETHEFGAYNRTIDNCFVAKASYSWIIKNKTILQLCAMYTGESPDIQFTSGRNNFTGAIYQRQWASGLNWLINRDKLKLGLHISGGTRTTLDNEKGQYLYLNPSVQFMI